MSQKSNGETTYSCLVCNKPDNARMVACDKCDAWFHFSCVGVTAAIANSDWVCSTCRKLLSNDLVESAGNGRTANTDENAIEPLAIKPSTTGGSGSGVTTQEMKDNNSNLLFPAEVGATLLRTQGKATTGVATSTLTTQNVSAHTKNTDDTPCGQTVLSIPDAQSELSSKSSVSSVHRLNQKMQLLREEQALIEKRECNLQQRKELLLQLAEEEDKEIQHSRQQQGAFPNQRVQISVQPTAESTRTLHTVIPQHQGQNSSGHGTQTQEALLCQLLDRLRVLESQNVARVGDNMSSQWLPGMPQHNASDHTTGIESNGTTSCGRQPSCRITRDQLAARNGICKDLPKFSGSPEEWPLFFASYEQTTALCGFSDAENLIRLRQALEGSARNSVKCLLLHAACVPQILTTLRMKFGRPELIIDTLLTRIKDMPAPKENRLDTVVDFAIDVQNVCATMKASGLTNHLSNPELEQELVCKLPGLLAAFWGMHKLTLSSYTLEHFSNWLFQFAQGANSVLIPSLATKNRKRGTLNAHTKAENNICCCICEGNCADVINCDTFVKMNRTEKWQQVREHKLCRRCLKPHHTDSCTSSTICNVSGCHAVHHPLLHKIQATAVQNSAHENCNTHSQGYNDTLFRVLPVILYGNGMQIKTFAFMDDGSSLTLMDEELMNTLNLRGTPAPLCLRWTSDFHRYEDDSMLLNMKISGVDSDKQFPLNDVHTVKSLNLPLQSLDAGRLKNKFKHLQGIPLQSYTDAAPRLLIGLNNCKLGLSSKYREGADDEPIAEKTRLGWTIKGQLPSIMASISPRPVYHICDCSALENARLSKLVQNYIYFDNLGITEVPGVIMSDEDKAALNQLEQHTRQVGDHFETSLLWKNPNPAMPNSLPMAKRRAMCLSLKMEKDPELAAALQSKIVDYVAKGYARKLSTAEIKCDKAWYLPVFPVKNQNKPGKIRIVWDAAAMVNGVSLNSMLLKGPDQLTSMVSVIRRFRQRRIAIGGDIAEMFHQIHIREADQKYQRFLWAAPGITEPEHYVMKVMTFGATCSPSCAQYVKNFNADRFKNQYPRAAQCIIDNHYVDDMLDSVNTEEEAISLARGVRFIHAKGGFHMRNWVSNSSKVLSAMEAEPVETLSLDGNAELPTEKVLGMWWSTSTDCLIFKISKRYKNPDVLLGRVRPTKREVLSLVMTIFDPLGLIAFFVTFAKIIFQETWRSGCSWDEPIYDVQYTKWLHWIKLLPDVENMKIPRCYINPNCLRFPDLEKHTFVDASESAYAAVCYLRCFDGASVYCRLVGSKSRVAPLKSMSIPKLELQAAVLGARLARDLCATHSLKIEKQTFWSDSTTVLAWLRSDHRRYRQFVAFRVSEILELTNLSDWRWVPTSDNVADEATKWQRTPDFSSHSRWLNAPSFLKLDPSEWPSKDRFKQLSTHEELRAQFIGYHENLANPCPTILSVDPERFSTWQRLLHITASIISVIDRWRCIASKSAQKEIIVRSRFDCIQRAEIMLFKEAQSYEYGDEIAVLSKGKPISKCSSIYKLSPYLDGEGVLRLGGRSLLENGQNPVILPKVGRITFLIVFEYHIKFKHCNHETAVNELRQKFWVPKLRAVLSSVRRSCQVCRNHRAVPNPPKMSVFPQVRVATFSRPFSYVGVDYFGPMLVSVRRSTEKRYGVLLTCLTTRAVHLEIAHSLSTDSCIIAIRNFIARRGTPIELWSDNGTNFKGTERELADAYELMDKDKIIRTFTSAATKWVFIPPASPHMGGAWERLVRSVKVVLYRVLPSRHPTDELLRSVFMEIEMIINSRPLTYIPISHENEEALTPNHFLLGSSSGAKPLAAAVADGVVLRKNWMTAQKLANAFWKRWLREYLPVITRRCKWFNDVKPIEVDDIVYIADPDLPRNCWPKGRVTEIHRSPDGQVRSATVKTAAGSYHRPATKIAVLEVKKEVGPIEDIPGGSVTKNDNPLNTVHICH